jgi:glycosyltransferase involved in cell wall biosynthesis
MQRGAVRSWATVTSCRALPIVGWMAAVTPSPDERQDRGFDVLQVGLGWPSHQAGGVNRHVADYAAALLASGVDAGLVVLGPASDVPPGTMVVSSHSAPVLRRLRTLAGRPRAVARASKVVHAHFALYALPIVFRLPRHVVLVAHFHGPWSGESEVESRSGGPKARISSAAKHRIERYVYRRADLVFTASNVFARLVVREYGVDPSRIRVEPPGVDLHRFSPGDSDAARRSLDLPTDARIAFTARRLVERVGVDQLIDAWPQVVAGLAGDRAVLLVIAGDGPSRADLERRADDQGVGDHVRFLGSVGDEDLVAGYRAADLVVVPTRSLEGFGLVVLEALACGTPVVATDVGGLPEVLVPLDETLVVPAGAPDLLAARIIDALDGGAVPSAESCRAYAERYDWRQVVDRACREYGTMFRA